MHIRQNYFITWSKYQHYLTSCGVIWQKSNSEINQLFGISNYEFVDISSNDDIAQWELENIRIWQNDFEYESLLAARNASWAVASQRKIYFHELDIYNSQFLSFYKHKLYKDRKSFIISEQQTITKEFLLSKKSKSNTINSNNDIKDQDILFVLPKIYSEQKVAATCSLLYWSASEKNWTVINLLLKKKVQLLDVYKIMYNYFTLEAVVLTASHYLVKSEVYILADSDTKMKVCFRRIINFYRAKKTAKSLEQLEKGSKKQKTQSRTQLIYCHNKEWYKNYLIAINALTVSPVNENQELVYKKSKCNGLIKKCFYYPICKKKYLVLKNPLLGYNQNTLSRACRNNIEVFSKKEVNLSSSLLYKHEYAYLADEGKLFTFYKEKLRLFLAEQLATNKKIIVWFDFETISSTIPFTNNPLIQSQTPFQVSIIYTDINGNVLSVINLIESPQKADRSFFKKIVNTIYYENAAYVVYNKSTECTILEAIKKQFFRNDKETARKINSIISELNLMDLMLPFKSINKTPPLVCIRSIKGSYSLKLVFDFILKTYPSLCLKAGASSYQSLAVSNGLTATIWGKMIGHNLITEHEWEQITTNLKKYCENDVRAMIVIYLFLRKILN